jgi:hypothetical protein
VIPLPSFLATPLRFVIGVLTLIAVGAGAVVGWRYLRDRDARQTIEAKPAIAENQHEIDAATAHNTVHAREYRSAVQGFRTAAATARANPRTTSETRACYDAGVAVISRCDSLHASDTTLIALYRKRAELMEGEAVRARRGRLLQLTAAPGYDPLWGAPAARVGLELNATDHWSVIGTYDVAAKIGRDSTTWRRSSFVGLNYRFGGRNP